MASPSRDSTAHEPHADPALGPHADCAADLADAQNLMYWAWQELILHGETVLTTRLLEAARGRP